MQGSTAKLVLACPKDFVHWAVGSWAGASWGMVVPFQILNPFPIQSNYNLSIPSNFQVKSRNACALHLEHTCLALLPEGSHPSHHSQDSWKTNFTVEPHAPPARIAGRAHRIAGHTIELICKVLDESATDHSRFGEPKRHVRIQTLNQLIQG